MYIYIYIYIYIYKICFLFKKKSERPERAAVVTAYD